MYIRSSCATLTPQGIAIQDAAERFGNGETLPFTPCKRGYIPMVRGMQKYACHIHNNKRKARVKRNGDQFKNGEMNLSLFWGVEVKQTIHEKESDASFTK